VSLISEKYLKFQDVDTFGQSMQKKAQIAVSIKTLLSSLAQMIKAFSELFCHSKLLMLFSLPSKTEEKHILKFHSTREKKVRKKGDRRS
jgi:hypothetical protein